MAMRKALGRDKQDVAAPVAAVQAAGPVRSGGGDVGSAAGSGDRTRGRLVKYRSIAGDGFYDAVVQYRLPNGCMALEISIPGSSGSLFYTGAVMAVDRERCLIGQCYPA